MTVARESWLRSSDDKRFGDAMSRCQHSGAFCAADGFCHYEGACFCGVGSKSAPEKRLRDIEARLYRLEGGSDA